MRRCCWLGAVTLTASVLVTTPAGAFAEDICFPVGGGAPLACLVLPANCSPVGTDTPACRAAAAGTYSVPTDAARSTIHADCTHILAQLVGFSADDAYWMAAYDEVADYGVFEAHDMQGQPVGGGALKTATLDGLERTSGLTGGALLHFVVPFRGDSTSPLPNVDGLHPDLSDAKTELLLAHLRAWAVAGQGPKPIFCTAGLTALSLGGDYATGDKCFEFVGGKAAPVSVTISLLGPTTVPFKSITGFQVLSQQDGGPPQTSPDFDWLVGGGAARISDARIGIYLHSLADRISHHVCADQGVFSGPVAGLGGGWTVELVSPDCAQGYHMLRHIWEVGVDFSVLQPRDRTTLAALDEVYDALVSFATARGVLRTGAEDPSRKGAIVAALADRIQQPDPAARILGLANFACAEGIAPFPGTALCPDAGAGTDAAISSDTAVSTDVANNGDTASDGSAQDSPTQGAVPGSIGEPSSGGCGCRTSDSRSAPLGLPLLGVFIASLFGLRRDRARSRRSNAAATEALPAFSVAFIDSGYP